MQAWRGKKALGWVPFAARAIKIDGDAVTHLGRRYRMWLSRRIEGKIKAGCLAHRLHRVAVQAEQFPAAGRKLDQIKGGWPPLVVSARRFLDRSAVIPNRIHPACQRGEMLAGCGVLDPVAKSQYHSTHYPVCA